MSVFIIPENNTLPTAQHILYFLYNFLFVSRIGKDYHVYLLYSFGMDHFRQRRLFLFSVACVIIPSPFTVTVF